METRGRKSKRKGYFYETEENAIVQYINEENEVKKNQIFNTILYPALTKMIESIIRRYKLFVPDEDFESNFNDTISYLLTKISHFRSTITGYYEIEGDEKIDYETGNYPCAQMSEEEYHEKRRNATDKDPEYIRVLFGIPSSNAEERFFKKETHKYKAYSYCGTVCKNYLMYKSTQYAKRIQRNEPYDDIYGDIYNSTKYAYEDEEQEDSYKKLLGQVKNEILGMLNDAENFELTDKEIIVGKALVDLLKNWEEVLLNGAEGEASNKLQKSSILYFLREETLMTTKEVRENMKPYKMVYEMFKALMTKE